jgi:hypothetical protein
MESITLRICDQAVNSGCSLCSRSVNYHRGPQLFLGESAQLVCRECARRTEPRLAGLVDLASIADKVGRAHRRLLTPPMETLLELARAAENYNQLSVASCQLSVTR